MIGHREPVQVLFKQTCAPEKCDPVETEGLHLIDQARSCADHLIPHSAQSLKIGSLLSAANRLAGRVAASASMMSVLFDFM
ncbi:hypothetical protein GOZ91_26580 [Agrobacterium vitis]|nr:hypothetical protein [Agrobacterium vitis]MVA38098.1 hypothetical protein [Agrobacterium vitis]